MNSDYNFFTLTDVAKLRPRALSANTQVMVELTSSCSIYMETFVYGNVRTFCLETEW
jgi:hypothetical protein